MYIYIYIYVLCLKNSNKFKWLENWCRNPSWRRTVANNGECVQMILLLSSSGCFWAYPNRDFSMPSSGPIPNRAALDALLDSSEVRTLGLAVEFAL